MEKRYRYSPLYFSIELGRGQVLTCAPQYSSTYEALEDSRPQRNRLAKLYIEQIPQAEYLELSESICGRVKVTMWQGLHFYPAPKRRGKSSGRAQLLRGSGIVPWFSKTHRRDNLLQKST
jgi:hypothetical protein